MSYIRKRVPKKKSKDADELVSLTQQITDWTRQNTNLVIYCGGAILFLMVATLGIMYTKSSKEASASRSFYAAASRYENLVRQPSDEDAVQDISVELLTSSLESFGEVADQYPGSIQADLAALYQANILFQLGSYRQAVDTLNSLIGSSPQNASEVNAHYLLARSYEALAEYDSAIGTYSQVLDRTGGDMRAVITMDMARCYLLSGDRDGAAELYRKVLKDHEATVYSVKAETKLATLGIGREEPL